MKNESRFFVADDPASDYDPDCRHCFRGRVHTEPQHEASIRRSFEASLPRESQYHAYGAEGVR